MIRIKNIVAQGGYHYSKYLKKQLAEVLENSISHKQYNMADIDADRAIALEDGRLVPIENLQRYTRITGALFDRWGLTNENYLTDAKIDQVCAIELGEDERTAGHIKPVLRNYKTVMGADGYPIEVHKKDITNGYYVDQYGQKITFEPKDVKTKSGFKKKTAIELVFSMDQTFSHASALMSQEDKARVAKLWMDCAEKTYKECFNQYLQTYHGLQGETGASLYFHNDSRAGTSHDHVHLNISNVIRLDDGKIMSIEIPAMREKNFHQSMDAMFKNMFIQEWQKEFGKDYPVEAYDAEKQSIKQDKFQTQEIENWRVAFTDDIVETIRQRSKSKELIDKVITQQKRDEYERTELKRMAIQEKINSLDEKIKDFELPSNYGVIKSFGAAPYQNDPKNTESYFVELELSNGKRKKIWGKDLEQAISNKGLSVGDFAGFSQTGQVAAKAKDKDGNWIDTVKKTWEGFDLSSHKQLIEELSDLDSQMKAINKAHESAIRTIESVKNRDAVWLTIKQKKKAIGKELKDVELAKEAEQIGRTIKAEKDRGDIFISKDDLAILDKLTNTNPYFTKHDLVLALSETQGFGSDAARVADLKIKEWTDSKLLKSTQIDPKFPAKHTTRKLALQEVENITIAKKLVNADGFKGVYNHRKLVADVIKGQKKDRRFNALQIDLLKAIVEPNGSRLILAEGFPGTGKSTVLGEAISLLQKQSGTNCLVLAPTGKVAASAGVDTTANHTGTIDEWLIAMDSGKTKIENNQVIFMDESGMVGTKNYNRFLNHVNKAVEQGIDVKVVLVGDTNQIQSVQAGNTYVNIVKDNQSSVRYLRKIIRQRDATSLEIANITSLSTVAAEDMAAVKKSGVHVEQSWKLIEESKRLLEFDTTTEKNEDLAARYITDANKVIDKVILCATNEDVKAINEIIQEKRLAAGEIGGKSIKNSDETFYVGDRVMVNKNAKEYKNGDFGIITKINNDGSFDVEFGEGKDSKIKTMKDPNKIGLAAAISIHKSQGLTVNNVWLNATESPVVDQELWNVAQTRARYITLTAVVKADKQKVLDAFKRENSKVNLYEVGLEVQADIQREQTKPTAPVAPQAEVVAKVEKSIEATKMATATIQAKSEAQTPTDVQPGRVNIMNRLKTKLKAFGKISNSVVRHREPPVAIIKQRQAEMAAKQAQKQAQVQQVQAVKQEQVKQAQIKKKKSFGLNR